MNKTEFIRAISDKVGFTIKDTAAFHDAFWAVVEETLKAGDKIQIGGVVSAELKSVDAKVGINPRTKEQVKIAACKKPVMKFSSSFKAKFN